MFNQKVPESKRLDKSDATIFQDERHAMRRNNYE